MKLTKVIFSLLGAVGVMATASAQFIFEWEVPGTIKDPQYTWLGAEGSVTFNWDIPLGTGSGTVFLENTGSHNGNITGIAVLMADYTDNYNPVDIHVPTGPFPPADGIADAGDYFGDNGFKLKPGEDLSFSFTFDLLPGFDPGSVWPAYEEAFPQVILRWMSVGIDDDDGSTVGWNGPGTGGGDPVIPEPRLIGALAVLGMGGLLYGRRRLQAKRAAQA
jgi:hypothetical protein